MIACLFLGLRQRHRNLPVQIDTRTAATDTIRYIVTDAGRHDQFQQHVAAVADLRVTIVGGEVFAAAVNLRDLDYDVDVRQLENNSPRGLNGLAELLARRSAPAWMPMIREARKRSSGATALCTARRMSCDATDGVCRPGLSSVCSQLAIRPRAGSSRGSKSLRRGQGVVFRPIRRGSAKFGPASAAGATAPEFPHGLLEFCTGLF